MTIHLRIPGAPYSTNYMFLEDTGASSMSLYQADVDELHWTSPGWRAPGLGFFTALTANGPRVDPAVLLEAAVISSDGKVLINWTPTTVLVFPGYCPPGDPHGRLSGRWFRQMIATVQIPDNSGRLYLGTEREDLDEVPGFDQRAARPPLITPHPPWQPPPAPPLPPPLSWEANWAMFPQAFGGMPSSPGPGTGAPAPPYTGPPSTGPPYTSPPYTGPPITAPHLTGPGGPLIVSGNKIPGGTAPQATANLFAHTGPPRGSTRQRLRNIIRRPFTNPRRRAGRYTASGDGSTGDGGNGGGGN